MGIFFWDLYKQSFYLKTSPDLIKNLFHASNYIFNIVFTLESVVLYATAMVYVARKIKHNSLLRNLCIRPR